MPEELDDVAAALLVAKLKAEAPTYLQALADVKALLQQSKLSPNRHQRQDAMQEALTVIHYLLISLVAEVPGMSNRKTMAPELYEDIRNFSR